jgi:hypothetical protein
LKSVVWVAKKSRKNSFRNFFSSDNDNNHQATLDGPRRQQSRQGNSPKEILVQDMCASGQQQQAGILKQGGQICHATFET